MCDTRTAACTTTSDQIRAVHDAFRLIDADGDMVVTLTDLRDIKTWTTDDRRYDAPKACAATGLWGSARPADRSAGVCQAGRPVCGAMTWQEGTDDPAP